MNRTLLAAAALLLAAFPLGAQQAPRPLSLDDALRIAHENNPSYRRAQAEVHTAEADVRRSRGAFYPTLGLGISTRGGYARTLSGTDQFGEPVERQEAQVSKSSSMSQSLNVGSITLFDGGAKLGQYRATQASATGTRVAVDVEELRLRGEVSRRYFRALQAERSIRLEEELLATAREQLAATEQLLRVGVRNPVDVLSAEVDVAEAEGALERARGDHRKAMLDLRQEMGVLEDTPLVLTTEAPEPFDPAPLDDAALLQSALASNPRVARVDAAVQAAGYRVRAARAGRFPTLSLGLNAGRSQSFKGYEGLIEPSPHDMNAGFSVGVTIPLFSQFQTSYNIASARAQRTTAEENARAERLAVERDVRGALIDLENAYRVAANAERTAGLNRKRLELATEQYRLGAIIFTELQDAVEGAARAEREALRTRFDFSTAVATLEEKVGAPVARP